MTASAATPATPATPSFPSRLPNVGTTIFTVMSALAAKTGAVNLGQGFPDFDCDAALLDAVSKAMRDGHNQYAPMAGAQPLRHAISKKIAACYGRTYDPDTEITVTAGATEALTNAILCSVSPGDEVIVLEPCYDSYVPAIELAGGTAVTVSLNVPEYSIPFDKLAAAIGPRTRLLIINTPHNPTGRILHGDDMRRLAEMLRGTDVLVLSDEVYEHMVFDGVAHESVARHPELAARSFVVSSFGKTYHTTGWKIGYVAAPAPLSAELRKVHQFNTFSVNTPMQIGLAQHLGNPAPYRDLPAFYARKRDHFRTGLAASRFKLLPCEGTYFQCVDYSAISSMPEAEFAQWLTTEHGVAAIPVSAFYREPRDSGIVRFCFAKREETLDAAIAKLVRL
ncbi:pyridoxal phosphate-dependent aminotransferase [Chitinasiproducens palmae]|uniref:2-keto-4-methylthiobutyrate aminotransferase apoenzyme n=1 Tax=Chitinasiproducens palmae TaxID=1770053 RepID=A0A1H2PSK5_9BURK|nr:pyridoxal phosphate-dependent aminotransferase [Chitinasiproducens palmae]SDV49987.1 2-keto-4-methylthiobutyrate aminotransferase apoenzyme [Chitinasiproducens palmae]